MLINLSNHPSGKWSEEQLVAAKIYGETIDLPFPLVDAEGDEHYIYQLADELLQKIKETAGAGSATVHLMGEMNLTYALVTKLRKLGITCVASTTERIVEELPDGSKHVVFQFKQFRKYGCD